MKWEVKKLSDVFDVRDGTHDSPKYQDDGYPLITSKNLKNNEIDFTKIKYISEEDYNQINKRSKVEKGDLLFAMIGTIGNPTIINIEPNFAIKNVALFKGNKSNSIDFLRYYLETKFVQQKMSNEVRGTTQKFVGLKYLRDFPFPVPPLEEQKRIVEILDESFAGIERAEAIARQNLTNASELFDSYLNVLFSKNHEAWITGEFEKIIGSVSTGPFGSLLHKSDYISDGIPLVNPANIDGDQIIPDKRKTVSKETLKRLNNYALAEKDIVFGRRGEIGRCAVVKNAEAGWLCGTGCFFIKPHKNIDSIFVTHLLRSPKQRERLENLATGATMKNLSNTALSKFTLSIPSFEEQKEIVFKLANLQEQIKLLETIYQRKIKVLGELKQSILQKAFSGQLTQ
jgi:type I restriction enzyme S subunit